jgi:hypothetical protein
MKVLAVALTALMAAASLSAERFSDSSHVVSFEVPNGWKPFERSGFVGAASFTAVPDRGPGEGDVVLSLIIAPAQRIAEQLRLPAADPANPGAAVAGVARGLTGQAPAGEPAKWTMADGTQVAEIGAGANGFVWLFYPDPGVLIAAFANGGAGGIPRHLETMRGLIRSVHLEMEPAAFLKAYAR